MNLIRIRISPFVADIILTSAASLFSTITALLITRLLANDFGIEKFGAYSLVKRLLYFIAPFSTFSMGVAITRYVAIYKKKQNLNSYLFSGLVLSLLPAFVIVIVGIVLPGFFTMAIFHSQQYRSLFVSFLFYSLSYSLYNFLFSYYRGNGELAKANFIQIVVTSLWPLLVCVLFSRLQRVDIIIYLFGTMFLLSSFPIYYQIFVQCSNNKLLSSINIEIWELFRYSFPRIPSGIALAGIFSIGLIIAPYYGSLKEVGYLAIGIAVFNIAETGISSFGVVVLPKVAQLHSEGQHSFLKGKIEDILEFIYHIGFYLIIHLLVMSDTLINIWLGGKYKESIIIVRIMLVSIIPYLMYVMLRSIIDAIEVRAINFKNLAIGFIVCLIISLGLASFGLGVISFAIGTIAGIFLLGVNTVKFLSDIYKIKLKKSNIGLVFLANLFLGSILIYVKMRLIKEADYMSGLFIIIIFEILMAISYVYFLFRLKSNWMYEVRKRIGFINNN